MISWILLKENEKLKHVNAGFQTSLVSLKLKVNFFEQQARKNNIIINDIKETYAEYTSPASENENPPFISRENTIKTACDVLKEACNITIIAADIASAYRLKSQRDDSRPLLVSLHLSSTKTAVIRACHPKQTLKFKQSDIYINDHFTSSNSKLSNKAHHLVKDHEAFSS